MNLSIDLPWLLAIAETAGAGDPAPEDFGVPLAAVARHKAALLDHDVYNGPYARAAALAHTLGRCRWLERSNMTVAVATAVSYLRASGRAVKPGEPELASLVRELRREECTAQSIAALLRAWPA